MTLNEASLEKRFNAVSTSQGSIQSLSFFCLHYKNHHKRIAQIWLRCLQKAKVPHRLTLIYLANDIVQNAKRKNTLSFIEDFKSILKEAVPYLRDDKIKKSVERVFSIWQDRNIFDGKFTIELKASLNDGGVKVPHFNEVPKVPQMSDSMHRHSVGDLMKSLERLESIERNAEKIRANEDNIVGRLAQNTFSLHEGETSKNLDDLKNYIQHLRAEIEERNKLASILENSMNTQRRLLKESEDQLVIYKSQLDYITKLREDIYSSM